MRRLDERELGKRLHEIAETNQAVFASARYNQISREYELPRGGALRQRARTGSRAVDLEPHLHCGRAK